MYVCSTILMCAITLTYLLHPYARYLDSGVQDHLIHPLSSMHALKSL